jgi:uncharacterized membrane protein
MGLAGIVILLSGVFVRRGAIAAARGIDKLVTLAPVFIATALATFAPEHFRGPDFVANMVPPYMPFRPYWAYLVGCALLAAALSISFRKVERASTTTLGTMFFLFVAMLFIPAAIRHPADRFTWTLVLRESSFCAGAWSLAAICWRSSAPTLASALLVYARIVLGIAAIFYGVMHFLHPNLALGVPLELQLPPWIPVPIVWAWLAGLVLVGSGLALLANKWPHNAAAAVGTVMTFFTAFLYGALLVHALWDTADAMSEAINYVADTLLYAGSALALALAVPTAQVESEFVEARWSSTREAVARQR